MAASARQRSVRESLLETSELLARVSGSPRREAELVLTYALGTSRTGLYLLLNEHVDDVTAKSIARIVEGRLEGKPLQYLLGSAGFFGLDLSVGEGALVPRPETEILVERALEISRGFDGRPLVVDLGTGSGAIAVALAVNDPRIDIVASDISPEALAIARRNADRYAVEERVDFVLGNLFEPLSHLRGRIDLVVSNPPYIPAADMPKLPADVRREPEQALDGGVDGLSFYRRIAAEAPDFLKPDGAVAVEVGDGQASAVADLLSSGGFVDIQIMPDLAGVDRVVTARWSSQR